jgi:hypothetical protein
MTKQEGVPNDDRLRSAVSSFEHSSFEFDSNFEFRHSNFPMLVSSQPKPLSLTSQKMSLTALLDQSLNLERQTISADASGGTVRTFAAVLSNIPCAVGPASASVVTDNARRDMIVDYQAYTTTDLDTLVPGGVKLGDRLTNGVVYYLVKDVKKSANKQITSELLYQLDCERRI